MFHAQSQSARCARECLEQNLGSSMRSFLGRRAGCNASYCRPASASVKRLGLPVSRVAARSPITRSAWGLQSAGRQNVTGRPGRPPRLAQGPRGREPLTGRSPGSTRPRLPGCRVQCDPDGKRPPPARPTRAPADCLPCKVEQAAGRAIAGEGAMTRELPRGMDARANRRPATGAVPLEGEREGERYVPVRCSR